MCASYSAWLYILNHYIHNYIIYAILICISAYNTNISKLFNMHIISIYVFINTLKYSSTIIGNKNLHIINTLLCCIMKCTMLHFIMCYYFMSINIHNFICIVSCKYTLYKYFIYKHIFLQYSITEKLVVNNW